MANEQNSININLAKSKLKPVFAEEIAIAFRVKAFKGEKGEVEKEGYLELIFIDMMKQQSVGEFVINRSTAKSFLQLLGQNIQVLEKELANKNMPKPPEIKSTKDSASYIR